MYHDTRRPITLRASDGRHEMPIIAMSGMLDNILNFLGYSSIQEFLIIILVLCISLSFHEASPRLGCQQAGR